MSETVIDPQQRLIFLLTEYARERNLGNDGNPLAQRGAAKGLYPDTDWHTAFKEMAVNAEYMQILKSCLPETIPKGKEGSLTFLAELDTKLKSKNIQVHIIPRNSEKTKNVTYFTDKEEHSVAFEMDSNLKAIHFCPAEEREVTILVDGEPKQVYIAKRIPDTTALLLISEEVLDDPFETYISAGHELGHQFELEQERSLVDSSGVEHIGVSYYTEIPSALYAIAAGNDYHKKYSVKMTDLYTLSESISLYNTVLDRE